jgi:hypothetical protein
VIGRWRVAERLDRKPNSRHSPAERSSPPKCHMVRLSLHSFMHLYLLSWYVRFIRLYVQSSQLNFFFAT